MDINTNEIQILVHLNIFSKNLNTGTSKNTGFIKKDTIVEGFQYRN